ncbi:MAG: carbonic anhydrase family protein [Betaproteobacteria bacterium]
MIKPTTGLITLAFLTSFSAASANAANADPKWSYSGKTGPARWAKLDKSFEICAEGRAQSPIDIPDAKVRKGDFPSMLLNYRHFPLSITDDGHELTLTFPPGSGMTIEDRHYELESLEFHKPGEHKVDGKGHVMEVQLIHKANDGKRAIVAVPVDQGKENVAIKAILENLPPSKSEAHTVPSVTINAFDLMPSNKDYYAYAGSDNSPPCAENVEWFVLKKPIKLSADQIARLGKIYSMNARPTQPVNGRDIRGSR